MQFVLQQQLFEQEEGIEEFLLDIEIIIDCWRNDDFQIRLFRKPSRKMDGHTYFDFYLDILEHPYEHSSFYMDSKTYAIKDLKDAFVEQIIDVDEEELQIIITYDAQKGKQSERATAKIVINKGNVIGEKIDIHDEGIPFSHLLSSLSFEDIFMGLPDFFDFVSDFELEFDDRSELEYATQDDSYHFGVSPRALPFVMQEIRPFFEAEYGFWMKVGCIRHKGFIRWTSGLEYALPQYFIVVRINEKSYFKVFPIMKRMWLKKRDWANKNELMLTFDTTLFDPNAKHEEGIKKAMLIHVDKEGIREETT